MGRWKSWAVFLIAGIATVVNAAPKGTHWESPSEKKGVDRKMAEVDKVIQKGPFQADWDSLKQYQIPDWYQDAKFGIFMHWGLYSVPGFANEWYSRNMYQQGDEAFKHHVATYGPQSKFGYKDFVPLFKAEKFDPAHWAKVFKDSGARYVVPVAEHHDGFALYDSDFSRWTAARMGPKQDLIGKLAQAVRKEGLAFGTSSHRAEHWWFMNGGMQFDSDIKDPRYADFYGPAQPEDSTPDEEYLRNWLARSCELVDKYKPQLVYFDWWIGERPQFQPYVKKFAAYYYDRAAQWKTGVVLNTKDKAFVPGATVQDVEKGKLPGIHPVAWQTDTSMSWRSWAYLKDDQLKDLAYLIRTLVDAVSKNGNLLLDIGPKPDGTLPVEQEKVLLEMGAWLKVNGEAIYGTRPWVAFGEGPTRDAGGKFSESDLKYQEGDLRFTRKGRDLYILTMIPPTRPLTVVSLGKKSSPDLIVKSVSLLGSKEPIQWTRGDKGLVLSPPPKSGSFPVVYKAALGGTALGPLEVRLEEATLIAGAILQNYEGKPVTRKISLSIKGQPETNEKITASPKGPAAFDLRTKIGKPGVYPIALKVEGHPALYGMAALPVLGLSGEWLFNKGDHPDWKKPGFADASWEKVLLPAKWNDHSQYNGEKNYGWYRKKLMIPAEWKGHSLILPLGKIDDADITCFNGHEIGRMGKFPPAFSTAWDQARRYEVPAKWIRYGKENVIAIRVYNGQGAGGLYDGPLGPVEVK